MDCVECLGSFVVLLMCRDMGYENDIFDQRCTAGGRTRIIIVRLKRNQVARVEFTLTQYMTKTFWFYE